MRKVLKFVIILALILLGALSVYKLSNKYNLNILKNNIDCTIVAKGCENAKAVTKDEDENIYVAFSNYIKSIDKNGKEKSVYKNKDMNIEDMVYYNESLIFVSGDSIYKFSLQDESSEVLCTGIPLSGNDLKRRILLKDKILFITVGARSNSGISEGDYEDLSPIDVTLNGVNYGEKLTGAFKKYGTRSEDGEKVNASKIGNASVYLLNPATKKIVLYASGIRGIKGLDYNSKGEVEAIFSGMKNEGLRAVARDKDYIYKVQKGVWYGWPDYSGGDPINSPRFKNEKLIKPLIKNMKDRTVPAPIYQSDDLNSLEGMAIDKKGEVLEKDTAIFWDSSKEKVCTLSAQNIYKQILKLKSNSNIESIVCTGSEFLLLDNGIGCVYSIHKKSGPLGFVVPVVIIFFVFLLVVTLLIITLYKLMKNNKN